MKNVKTLLLSASAATALFAAAQATAAIYEIDYGYIRQGKYTSSKPMVGGVPDPNGALGPSGSATHNIPPVATNGKGWINTDTGEIFFGPVDIEINVTSGSFGYVGWSQKLLGSFSGTTFTMSGNATVKGGASVCELATSSSCTDPAVGGVGAPPPALKPPQLYPDPVLNIFGQVVTPGGPLTLINTISFSSFAAGGTGQYLFQDNLGPAYEDSTINITVGKVVYLPIPTSAWLFAPGLLTLVAGKRYQRKKNK
ncbi:MAG: hypothetical protein QM709_12910 [Spongiibacteraceae bacterium]